MHQRIRMSQVIQKPIPKPLPLMRARDQARHVEQLNRYTALPINARPVVRFTTISRIDARTGTLYLKVPNGPLGIYSCESEDCESGRMLRELCASGFWI